MNSQIHTTERQLRERRSWILAGLISLALLSCFAFPLALLTGCDDDDYRKAVRSAAAIATSLKEVQAVNEQAYAASFIDRDEAIAIARGVKDASLANDHFVSSLRKYSALNRQSKAELVRMVADVARSLRTLNEHGVLRIKNPSVRLKFVSAISGAITALDVLAAIIGQHENPAVPQSNILQSVKGAEHDTRGEGLELDRNHRAPHPARAGDQGAGAHRERALARDRQPGQRRSQGSGRSLPGADRELATFARRSPRTVG